MRQKGNPVPPNAESETVFTPSPLFIKGRRDKSPSQLRVPHILTHAFTEKKKKKSKFVYDRCEGPISASQHAPMEKRLHFGRRNGGERKDRTGMELLSHHHEEEGKNSFSLSLHEWIPLGKGED